MLTKAAIFVVHSLLAITLVAGQCSVNIRTDIPTKDPVYLTSTGALWAPNGPALTWATGQQTLLVCSGSGNSLTLNGQATSTMACVSGTTFTVGGVSATTGSLTCKNTITGDYQNTGRSCGHDGTLINLGFNTGATHGFTTYIESCYSMVTGSLRYTRHIIPGQAIAHHVIESTRPSFKTSGSAPHVSPSVSYTQAAQKTRLTALLGSQAQAEKYLSSTSFMARGHLSPDGDGIFRTWQFCTYWYTNVAPQWQVVNAGNWLRVEDAARTKAERMGRDLLIFSGTYGILTLANVNNQQVPITLEDGGIEAPKWFWKIIKDPSTGAGIAMVTLNNPFVTSIAGGERLCDDICSSSGWYLSYYENFAKGLTYCCDVNDLRTSVTFIPSEAATTSILTF